MIRIPNEDYMYGSGPARKPMTIATTSANKWKPLVHLGTTRPFLDDVRQYSRIRFNDYYIIRNYDELIRVLRTQSYNYTYRIKSKEDYYKIRVAKGYLEDDIFVASYITLK